MFRKPPRAERTARGRSGRWPHNPIGLPTYLLCYWFRSYGQICGSARVLGRALARTTWPPPPGKRRLPPSHDSPRFRHRRLQELRGHGRSNRELLNLGSIQTMGSPTQPKRLATRTGSRSPVKASASSVWWMFRKPAGRGNPNAAGPLGPLPVGGAAPQPTPTVRDSCRRRPESANHAGHHHRPRMTLSTGMFPRVPQRVPHPSESSPASAAEGEPVLAAVVAGQPRWRRGASEGTPTPRLAVAERVGAPEFREHANVARTEALHVTRRSKPYAIAREVEIPTGGARRSRRGR